MKRISLQLLVLNVLGMVALLAHGACAPPQPDYFATDVARSNATSTAKAATATAKAFFATETALAKAGFFDPTLEPPELTLSAPDEKPAVPSVKVPGVSGYVGNMHSAFDGQGAQHLFYTTAPAGDGNDELFQQQLNADGTWTAPQPVTADFGGFSAITPLPDSTGRMCVLWSGEFQGTPNYVSGLYRSCQNDDGAWSVVQEPVFTGFASANAYPLSLTPAPDGRLNALYMIPAAQVFTLFFSQIDLEAGPDALEGVQLSGDKSVFHARLAIDSNGGYHAIWVDTGNDSSIAVQYRYSTDGGQTWAEAEQLYSGSADNPDDVDPLLVADRLGSMHLAWEATPIVFYRRWTPAGGWEEMVDLSQGQTSSGVRLATTNRGLARALWNGKSGVWFGEQTSDGTWKAQVVTGYANDMALAVDENGLSHLVWNGEDGLSYATIREVTQASGPSVDSATPTPRPTLPPPTPPFGGQGPADIPSFGSGDEELVSADQDTLIYLLPVGYFEKLPFFYPDLMHLYGWTEKPGGTVSQGGKVTMQFTKDNRTATIVISQESDGRTRVVIEITRP